MPTTLTKRARVVLADDYGPAHGMYRKLLEPDVDVIAAVFDGESSLKAARTHVPDLMLLDVQMGAVDGFSVARWLKRYMPDIKILFVTMHGEPAYIREAVGIGADGYVIKSNAVSELLQAVQDVLEGGKHFPVMPAPG